jgi:carboxylate-amine ligase
MDRGWRPDWAEWRFSGDEFSVGIEEEAMLLEPVDWGLAQLFDSVEPRLSPELASTLSAETHRAAAEFQTGAHARPADAAAELAHLQRRLTDELSEVGLAAAGSGTHPFSTWEETQVSHGRRYRYVHETMRELARREPTYALHVHVAVSDPELAVAAANRVRAHLPVLLAVSANSPFWQGRDSGMASARTPIFQAFPRVGIPREWAGYRDYVERLETLIACGAFPDPSFVWWDLRLQPALGTIEVRVMDAQSEIRRTAALTGLVQALVRLEALEGYAPAELVGAFELLEENRFIAARDGVGAELLDPVARRAVPVAEVVDELLEAVRPHAADLGSAAELEAVEALLTEPAHALQRELAGPEHDLRRLVAALAERFSSSRRSEAADRPPARSAGLRRSQ